MIAIYDCTIEVQVKFINVLIQLMDIPHCEFWDAVSVV